MRLKNQISVVMVIATDGEENASRTFSKERVKLMIETCTARLGWQFMYICEDLESFSQGRQIGIQDTNNAMHHTPRGTIGNYLSNPSYGGSLSKHRATAASYTQPSYVPNRADYARTFVLHCTILVLQCTILVLQRVHSSNVRSSFSNVRSSWRKASQERKCRQQSLGVRNPVTPQHDPEMN